MVLLNSIFGINIIQIHYFGLKNRRLDRYGPDQPCFHPLTRKKYSHQYAFILYFIPITKFYMYLFHYKTQDTGLRGWWPRVWTIWARDARALAGLPFNRWAIKVSSMPKASSIPSRPAMSRVRCATRSTPTPPAPARSSPRVPPHSPVPTSWNAPRNAG